jgi:ATPase subunit of ABC transporter with duplicated ATPase domains
MLSIRLASVSFGFSNAAPIFNGLDLELNRGFTGIVGPNGAGKTTLLRLITGDLAPDLGFVQRVPASLTVALCPQTVEELSPEITALAEAEDGEARRLRAALALDDLAISRFPTLSPGERKRWQVGAALYAAPEALLLDEPTNHLDAEARGLLAAALSRYDGLGLLVSHDRALLERLTSATLFVAPGAARLYRGAYGRAKAARDAAEAERLSEYARLKHEAERARRVLADKRRTHDSADRGRSAASRMKGVRDHDGRSMGRKFRAETAERRSGREVEVAREKAERLAAAAEGISLEKAPGRSVFVGYERPKAPWLLSLDAGGLSAGGRSLLGPVSLALGRDDRVWLSGPNGAGKTTLLTRLLEGARVPRERLFYLPQELSPEEGAALLAATRALPALERGRVLSLAAALGVEPERLLLSRRPSPGEARKLGLAYGLGRHVWGLLLDEPTNHLDLPSIERLEAALGEYPGALLLVSHDETLARRCASREWRIVGQRVEAVSLDWQPSDDAAPR